MAETRDRGEERPVVTSAVWPVPRAVVIRRDGDERGMLKAYTLRWLMLRMIAEYAQHAGHADFLREGIDGAVGA
jgi:hypothetical protein